MRDMAELQIKQEEERYEEMKDQHRRMRNEENVSNL